MDAGHEVSETVRELATRLLARVDDMADELVAQILRGDDRYTGTVPPDDLRISVADNMAKIINVIAGDDEDPARYDPPRATGRRRAEQGLPLEALLHSYRAGGRIIWKRMVELTREQAPERLDDLLDGATQVWDAIDEYSTVVGESYRATEARLARIDLQRQAATVEALLAGDARPSVSRRAADLLGDLQRLVVVVVEGHGEADRAAVTRTLRGHGLRSAWQPRPPGLVGIVASPADEAALEAGLRERIGGRAGVSLPATGPRDLPTAHEQAELALRLAGTAPSVVLLGDHLREAAVLAAGRLSGLLETQVLGQIDALPAAEADDLLATADAYLSLGSVSTTARRLHCHRNTVLNRLKRIAHLTGLDLGVPEQAASLVMALDARRGGQTHTTPT